MSQDMPCGTYYFNRTNMELKPDFEKGYSEGYVDFNRTNMELKRFYYTLHILYILYFNRTNMELKLSIGAYYSFSAYILIAPIWN